MQEQAGPPEALRGSLGFLLAWVAAASGERYAEALAPLGLTAQHVALLTLVAEAPAKQAHLSDRLGVFKPVMVKLVNDLEGQGLVERRPHPTDGRAVEVHLLPAGRRSLTRVRRIGDQVTDDVFATLTPPDRATLARLLGTVADGLTGSAPA